MSVSGSQYVDIAAVNASGDLTSSQFYFVQCTGVDSTYSAGNLTTKICTGSSNGASAAYGILQNDPDTGEAAIIRVEGLSKLVASAAISVGALVSSTTAGKGVASSTTGQWARARAESASTADGQIITVRLLDGASWTASTA